jgi:DNA-binding NarL/FixJ family response regulator
MPHHEPTRQRDEEILRWLQYRAAGFTPKEIALRFGTSVTSVRALISRVIKHDSWHHNDRIEFDHRKKPLPPEKTPTAEYEGIVNDY